MHGSLNTVNPGNVRAIFERMGADAAVLSRVSNNGVSPQHILDAVKDLPIYADRSFVVSDGMEAFLENLPLLTKADLRRNFPHGFLPPDRSFAALLAAGGVLVARTSGTSEDRLQVLWNAEWWDRQERAALTGHPLIGPHLGDDYREAVLTTPLCSENVCLTGPTPMEERRIANLLFLNTQHDPTRWTAAELERMAEEIDQFRPHALEADPVYLAAFARYLRDSGRSVPRLGWIILAYEFVSALDKDLIRSVFNCPVFEFYGLTEAGVFFLECQSGRHHFCGSDAMVEILRPPCSELPAGIGEVVVTTWGNSAQPLLRYRTGDLAMIADGGCPCGVPGPTLSNFVGRIRDLLEISDGRIVTPRAIDSALSGTAGLANYQCVQEDRNALCIACMSDRPRVPEGEILRRLRGLRAELDVHVEEVTFITPEPSGKYRRVIPL